MFSTHLDSPILIRRHSTCVNEFSIFGAAPPGAAGLGAINHMLPTNISVC